MRPCGSPIASAAGVLAMSPQGGEPESRVSLGSMAAPPASVGPAAALAEAEPVSGAAEPATLHAQLDEQRGTIKVFYEKKGCA